MLRGGAIEVLQHGPGLPARRLPRHVVSAEGADYLAGRLQLVQQCPGEAEAVVGGASASAVADQVLMQRLGVSTNPARYRELMGTNQE
jgi:hypothetical protein